jgi:FKBP-type peptidyl-prolyl cis-trans isomerase
MNKKFWIYGLSSFILLTAIATVSIVLLNSNKAVNSDLKKKSLTMNNPPAIGIKADSNDQQNLKVTSSPTGQLNSQQIDGGAKKNAVDPSTFAQYDNYKNSTNCLFGDLDIGTGATVVAGSKVAISYSGWLTNGTLFDHTKTDANGNQQPFLFTEGAHEVLSGIEECVAGMKVGGRRLIIVPPAVGYGSKAQGNIPENATLVFEVTLVAAQ